MPKTLTFYLQYLASMPQCKTGSIHCLWSLPFHLTISSFHLHKFSDIWSIKWLYITKDIYNRGKAFWYSLPEGRLKLHVRCLQWWGNHGWQTSVNVARERGFARFAALLNIGAKPEIYLLFIPYVYLIPHCKKIPNRSCRHAQKITQSVTTKKERNTTSPKKTKSTKRSRCIVGGTFRNGTMAKCYLNL